MELVGVLRIAVNLRDRLDAGGDEDVALAGLDRVEGHPDRLQAGGAEAVHRRPGDVLRQARQQRRAARDVHPLLLLGKAAPHHHVDDLGGIELRHLLERRADGERDQVVGSDVDEGPFPRAAYRRPDGGGDDGFGHQTKALSPVSARPMISFWIWLVPSYKVVTLASRRYLPTGYSST
jgi:hypothetical protein